MIQRAKALSRGYKPKYNCKLALLECPDFMRGPQERALPLKQLKISIQNNYGRKN
jgi:hypothetical protein